MYRHFDVENGLPSSEVYQSFQDRNGYMWFATDLGLARFDGYTFETFDTHDGLADNVNFSFFEDAHHRIWLSGHSIGLSYISDSGIFHYAHNDVLRKEVAPKVIRNFEVDIHGNVRFTISGQGVLYTINTEGQIKKDVLPDKGFEGRFYGAQEIPLGQTLVNTCRLGPLEMDTANILLRRMLVDGRTRDHVLKLQKGTFEKSASLHSVNYIKTGPDAFVFLTNGIMMEVTAEGTELTWPMPFEITNSLNKDSEGNIWFGTFGSGLVKVSKDRTLPIEQYFKGKTVSHINQDREGGYWVCTLNDGVYYIPDWEIRSAVGRLQNNTWVRALLKKDSVMLAGQDDGVLYQWHISNMGFPIAEPYQTKLLKRTYSLKEFGQRLLSTSNNHMGVFPFKGFSIENFPGRTAIVASNGRVWIAGGSDVSAYENGKEVFSMVDSFGTELNGLALIEINQSIWVGHRVGLYEIKNGQLTDHSLLHPELGVRVNDIKAFRDGIVLATPNGVFYYANNKLELLAGTTEMQFSTCRTLEVESSSTIWVGTNRGLGKLNIPAPLSTSDITRSQLFYSDGLSSGNIYDIELTDKYVWTATTAGVDFLPKKYKPTPLPEIPIQITEVQVNGKPRAFPSGVELAPGNNDLLFTFKGLCLRCGGKVLYKYRLIGADSSWKETNSQLVQFANLAPGSYRFELMVASYSGTWNESRKIIEFYIKPRIWQIPWVQWVLVIGVIVLTAFLIRRRFQNVRKQNKFELEIDQLKFQALNAQMNPHFVFNAMNAIQQFVLRNDVRMSNKYLGKFARLTRLVLDNSREQLVDLQSDLDALRIYIELEALRFPKLFEWKVEVDQTLNPMAVKIPPLLLQPLVENSIKHGLVPKNGDGLLTISILLENNQLHCIVTDNGIGREASSLAKNKRLDHKPVGLGHTQKRIELLENMHGKKVHYEIMDLKSENGAPEGTRVSLRLPLLTSSYATS